MTDELQPLGGKRIIQSVGYVCIVLGLIVLFSEHIAESWPVFDARQAVSATSAQNKIGGSSCSERYGKVPVSKIFVEMPADGSKSEEVTGPNKAAGACYWFLGPEGTKVWFPDGTNGPITKHYTKPSVWRFSNPNGGRVVIEVELENGGLSSAIVADLQARLAQDKTIYPEGIVSGIYGNLTTKAVTRFQKKYQLAATGVADPATIRKIQEMLVPPSKSRDTGTTSKDQPTPPPPPQKPGAITAVVKDQFGSPMQVSYWVEGERGVEAVRCCSETNAQTGRLQTPVLEPGQYVLHIEDKSYLHHPYDSITRSIDLPLGGLWLDTITVKRRPIVAARLILPSNFHTEGIYLLTAKGEQLSISFSSPNASGRIETLNPVPFGSYTFRVKAWGGIGTERSVQERNIQVTESDKEVWLGDVVLTK